ncbi:MAG TPA: hypothetical protein VIG32_08435 [Candidatus Baltobacteraceae bacterium]|jgi:hypothetical protein
MRPNSKAARLLLSLALAVAPPPFYLGVQGLGVTGVHSDVGGSQRGAGAGALLEIGATLRRLGVHVEGIPPVSLPQRPSAFYGQATPKLSLLNGAVRFAVDPQSRLWLGIGATVINQATPLPNIFQVAGSRLAGVRYEAFYRAPMRGSHFAEILIGGAPRLYGADHFIFSDGSPSVTKDERASEVDASVAVGIRHAHSEVLFGLRTINFAAQFTKIGEAADRNNGAGVLVELRRLIGP